MQRKAAVDPELLRVMQLEDERMRSQRRRDERVIDEYDLLVENERRRERYAARREESNKRRRERQEELFVDAREPDVDCPAEDTRHAGRILAGAARRAKEYRERLAGKADAGDTTATAQLSKRQRQPASKQRAVVEADDGALPLCPLLTALPFAPSAASVTPMEKALLIEDAAICARMACAVLADRPQAEIRVLPFMAAALGILAGRFLTADPVDAETLDGAVLLGPLLSQPDYDLAIAALQGMLVWQHKERDFAEIRAREVEHIKQGLAWLSRLESRLRGLERGAVADLRARCELNVLDAPWARPGWGGQKTEVDTTTGHHLRYHPLKDFGGTSNCMRPWARCQRELQIRRPPKPRAEAQRVWSTEGQCEGTTRLGERCKVHKSSWHADAAPLRRGERFCAHHDPARFTGVRCRAAKKHSERCNVWSGMGHADAAPLRHGSPYCHHHRRRCHGMTCARERCTVTSSSQHAHAQPLREGSRYCAHHSSDAGLVCGAVAEGSGLSLDGGVTFVCPQDEEEASELRMQCEAEEAAMNGPRLLDDETE